MKSILALTLATLAFSSPVPSPAQAAALSPPSFRIKNVVSGGSGCPQGSIDINFSDSTIMPILFSRDFTAAVGPSTAADQARKNCQINMALQYSPGWSYAVYSADYSGWADLDNGVNGIVKSTYYFSGQTDQVSDIHSLKLVDDCEMRGCKMLTGGIGFEHYAIEWPHVRMVQEAR
jgi:hypothetical protein